MAIPGIPGAGAVPSGQPAGDTTNVQRNDTTFTLNRPTQSNKGTQVEATSIPKAQKSDDDINLNSGNTLVARIIESPGLFSRDAWLILESGGSYKFKDGACKHGSPDNLNIGYFSANGKDRVSTSHSVGALENRINKVQYAVKTSNDGTMQVELTPNGGDYVSFEQWVLYQYNSNE